LCQGQRGCSAIHIGKKTAENWETCLRE